MGKVKELLIEKKIKIDNLENPIKEILDVKLLKCTIDRIKTITKPFFQITLDMVMEYVDDNDEVGFKNYEVIKIIKISREYFKSEDKLIIYGSEVISIKYSLLSSDYFEVTVIMLVRIKG